MKRKITFAADASAHGAGSQKFLDLYMSSLLVVNALVEQINMNFKCMHTYFYCGEVSQVSIIIKNIMHFHAKSEVSTSNNNL